MPFYKYKAKNRDNYIINDIMEAQDKGDAVRRIKRNNMVPIDIVELKITKFMKGKEINLTSGVKKQDLVFFLAQLYNLLNAGLTLFNSFRIIIDQTSNKYLQKYLIKILQDFRN